MHNIRVFLKTLNRFDLTTTCVPVTLANAGYPYELMVIDQGSIDQRLKEWLKDELQPDILLFSKLNQGIAKVQNTCLNYSINDVVVDYYCFIDNDIRIDRKDWLKELVDTNETAPNSGVAGVLTINAQTSVPNLWEYDDLPHAVDTIDELNLSEVQVSNTRIHPWQSVTGTRFFSQKVVDKIGYFCEDYDPYGFEDSEYSIRASLAGFINYYLDGPAIHLGEWKQDNTDYLLMKHESIEKGFTKFKENMKKYLAGNCYVGLPAR